MECFFCFVPCVMFDGFSSMHFDLIDLPHMSSFYYVNWDDPIYDQFDDYMEKLEQEEEKAKQDQRSKGTVRLDYKVYFIVKSGGQTNIFVSSRCHEDLQNSPHMDHKSRMLPPSKKFPLSCAELLIFLETSDFGHFELEVNLFTSCKCKLQCVLPCL